MSDELDRLWALHGLDDEIVALRERLGRVPTQKAALDSRVTAERARLEGHGKSLAEVQRKRRELEREIEGVDAQERKFLSQQVAVKTNAEYQALTHEIAGCKERRSALETDVLIGLEAEERLAAERAAIDKALAAAEAERTEKVRALDAEETRDRAEVETRETRRAELLAGLPASTRQRYERIHASRGGRAVVPIVKGACGGCFRAQPPQVLQEARRRDRLQICEGCGRIIVLPPEGSA